MVELPFSTLVWQPRPDAWRVTIVCKATFSIEPNELGLARDQQPIIQHDSFWDDDPSRSLAAASDLAPSKQGADVVVVGSAFAPAGQAVGSMVARLSFESIDKSIEIVADRSVGADGTVYQGERFARMPLVYERAAGGPGTWNPVGIGPGTWDAEGRALLPNITPVGKGEMTASMPEPIGFGPIAPTWPGRTGKLGVHAQAFDDREWQHQPLPEGLDVGYFNVAPVDQQVDSIPENASLLLQGLHAQHSVLSAKLPGIHPRVMVERRSGKERPEMRADTLVIDTDRALLVIAWRGHVSLEFQQETFRVSADAERPRTSWRTMPHTAPTRNTLGEPGESTVDGVSALAPFTRSAAPTTDPGRTMGAALPFQNIARAVPMTAYVPPTAQPPTSGYAKPAAGAWGPSAAVAIVVQPPPVITHASAAGFGGVVSASNAAADAQLIGSYSDSAARGFAGDALQLLWFMPEAAGHIRRNPEWKTLLDALPPATFDPEVDDPSVHADPSDIEETREIYEVIARGSPGGHDSIDRALLDEARSDGRFAAQLLLLRGELHFDFDEVEMLKAVVSAVAPFTPNDEALKKTVEQAANLLAAPGLVVSPDVVNAVTATLRDAFKSVSRPVPATYLDDQTERALLERRAYQKRAVFGQPHLRGLFFFGHSTSGIPAYFPVKVAQKLPLLRRVRVRALCEAHFQADQYESHHAALRGAAVARIVR